MDSFLHIFYPHSLAGDILTQYPEYIPGLADGQTPLEQERVDLTPSASALGLKPLLIEQATKDGAVSQLYLHGLHAPPASLLPDRAAFAKARTVETLSVNRWGSWCAYHPFLPSHTFTGADWPRHGSASPGGG